MDEFGPMKDNRDGESDARGKVPANGIMDDCFQSLMTKNPNQKITIHDPCIIKTGKADLRAKRENTMEITAETSSVGGKHMKETSCKEESLRVKGFIQFSQDKSGHTDFLKCPYTQMESKSFTELHQSKMEVQHTDLEPHLGLIKPQGTRMEALDLSLKNKNNKLQDACSSTKLLPEELTEAVSSSVKGAAIPEFTPSSLPKKMQYRLLSRSQPYRIPIRIEKNLIVYGMFQPEFIVNSEDGNSSQEMSRRDEDERGRIPDALKVYHIDRPPPEVTSLSAYSSVSGQLTIPEYIHKSRNHDNLLNEIGSAVAVEKATIDTSYSCIPLLDETQTNVNTWHTPKTQSWRPKLRDKLVNKKCNGGTKPFK